MVGKSKGKQRPPQVAEPSVAKTAADNAKALGITQRLRKGRNLEALAREAIKLAGQETSAISQLCLAKVALAQAIEGIMKTSLTEVDNRPAVYDKQKEQLQTALTAARQGALQHSSILCGRFYYKLAEVVEPDFAGINWPPGLEGLADPQTELLEQGSHLCDFETWKDWKGSPQEVKLKMRLEMEKGKANTQRYLDNAADIAEGIMKSGLLYDSHRQHLSHALNKRQGRLQNLDKSLAQQNAQLIQHLNTRNLQEIDFGHQFDRVKPVDDDENTRSAKQDGLEKRQKQKRETEVEMRKHCLEEVVGFVKQEVTQHLDNESRLASLTQITSVPLDDILKAIAADATPEFETQCIKMIKGLECLRPEEGGICKNTMVVFDDKGTAEPVHQAYSRLRDGVIASALKSSPYERKDSHAQARTDPVLLATEVWDNTWNQWLGQVPPDMSPVDSLSELKGCLESFPPEYQPTPLDEPSVGLHSLATSQLLHRLSNEFDDPLDSNRVSSGLLQYLRGLLGHKSKDVNVLRDLASDCCQAMPNQIAGSPVLREDFQDFLPHLDGVFELDVTLAEAHHLRPKVDAKQYLKCRGQLAVSIAELTPQAVANSDPKSMDEFGKLFLKGHQTPIEIFRLESRLEGRSLSASDFADTRADEVNGRSVDSDDMSDGGSTVDMENGSGHSEPGSAAPWWGVVLDRFPIEKIRAAILEEIRLAAEVLVGSNHFTSSIAQAVSSHIYSYIELEKPEDFEGHVFLDHARLLDVEPLRALLDFLWLQLGLRWNSLHWVIQADNLIGMQKAPSCEILPDTVRYSHVSMNAIKCRMESGQGGEEAAEPHSPVRSSVSQNGQADQLQTLEHLSPKQLQEAYDQHDEEHRQYQDRHVLCGSASIKPEVNEEFLRVFVKHVLFPLEAAEQPEEIDPELHQVQHDRLRAAVAEAVHVARTLADACGYLAFRLDGQDVEQHFPQRDILNDFGKRELLSQLNPADGHAETMVAILACMNMAETRKAASQLPVAATSVKCSLKRGQEHRARTLQSNFKRMHLDNMHNMGVLNVTSLAHVCKAQQLYHPGIIGTQEAGEHMARMIVADSGDLKSERYAMENENEGADMACTVPRALETYQYYQRSLGAPYGRQQMQQDGRQLVQKSLKQCADSIMRLSMYLDMLVLQIGYLHSLTVDIQCDNLDGILQRAHNEVLRTNLIKLAKEHKARMEQQAAERNAQELLATEAQSKSHPEGEKKKGKKKKKGAKQREDKQEEPLPQEQQPPQEPQEQEPQEEDPQEQELNEEAEWEQAVSNVVANLPPGLQHAASDSRSPPVGGHSDKDEEYRRRLRGDENQEDEDWSTVDKKKSGKGKAGSKQPDTASATAAAAIPNSWEEDGWEVHSNLLDAARPTPPGLHPRADAKASSNDENMQPGQEPATPSGYSSTEVQCEKCGRWGHSERNCSEQYCDLCSMHGHSTVACPKKSLRAGGRGASEQERGPEAPGGESQREQPTRGQTCYACGMLGHLASACPKHRCYNCQQMGHKAPNCPNPAVPRAPNNNSRTASLSNSRRREGDAQSSGRQQGAEQAEEQLRGRQRGRGREQQAEASSSGSATLPMTRPGRRGPAGRHAQQDLAVEYPSLTGHAPGNSLHESAPSTASFGPQPPPPPPPREANAQWDQIRSAPNQLDPRQDGRGGRAQTSGWDHSEPLHEQAIHQTWDEEEEDDGASFQSTTASPRRHSPHRSQPAPMHSTAWGSTNRPSSARSFGPGDFPDRASQGSGASVSGQSHAALPHGLLQPGMNGLQASAWAGGAFAPHSLDPQLALTLPDQLAPQHDPIVSPGFTHRSAPARAFQPQQSAFNPAAPLQSYVAQEARTHVPWPQAPTPAAGLVLAAASAAMPSDDDIFLNELLAEQHEDNKPVGIYAPAAPASAALWPALDAQPATGQTSWAARLDVRADPVLDPGQEDEQDEDLQKALQASLEETQSEQKQTAYAAELLRQGASHEPATTSTMGLRNATGEYNCFLNVIIQCMWHCHAFRQAVMGWDPAAYQDNEVVRALIGLFKAFAEREKSKTPSKAVDPTQLREALGNLEGDKFKVGQMGDAAEVLTALYEKLAGVAAQAGEPSMLDDNFGLHVKETVWCGHCKKTSHQHSYVQYFFNVMSYSLALSQVVGGCASFGETLKDLEGQTSKSCDTDIGGCGRMFPVQHCLVGTPPHIFTMQLAWQSNNEKSSEINSAMTALSQTLDLGDVYYGIDKHQHIYHLRSMVCYYGQHYLAFVLMPGDTWFMFDDASMLRVGSWADVINKSTLGRTQASVLFFEHE